MEQRDEFIVLLAHGSSDPAWGETFTALTSFATERHEMAKLAFMELSEPLMDDVIREAALAGHKNFRVIPLFLAKGRHLKVDVPGMLDKLETELGIKTSLGEPIGKHPALAKALNEIISEALN